MSKVVVMVEGDDGRRDWWEVFDVEEVQWTMLEPGRHGARVNMVVRGSFYRKATDNRSREISSALQQAMIDEFGGFNEVEGGDYDR